MTRIDRTGGTAVSTAQPSSPVDAAASAPRAQRVQADALGRSGPVVLGTDPFRASTTNPFGAPSFSKIKNEDYLPAILNGIAEQRREVVSIARNPRPASFENTVAALEGAGRSLGMPLGVLYNLRSSHGTPALDHIAKRVSGLTADLSSEIYTNRALFQRVKAVYDERDSLAEPERRLTELYYNRFVAQGISLGSNERARLGEINKRLSELSLDFGTRRREAAAAIELHVDDESRLEGLPQDLVKRAAEHAKDQGKSGWLFKNDPAMRRAVLRSAKDRDLRRELHQALVAVGTEPGPTDTRAIVAETVALRAEAAEILGFKSHAERRLENNLAKSPARVNEFLNSVLEPSLEKSRVELAKLEAFAKEMGAQLPLKAWDLSYYSAALLQREHGLDVEEVRQYLQLPNVKQAAFDVANRLFGVRFERRDDVETYHPDVEAYEVKGRDGNVLGLIYFDFLQRPEKSPGAWMNNFRDQYSENGKDVRPIVVNVCNFSPGADGKPPLLTFGQVTTLFHELGHGLHGLFAQGDYASLSGTNVPRDFVEMPSQLLENWAADPDVLRSMSAHVETGRPIPDALIGKLEGSKTFNQGISTVRYLASAVSDMRWHTLGAEQAKALGDVTAFEDAVFDSMKLPEALRPSYRTPNFGHVFSGGYHAGYYSYLWSEMLDADAFEAFQEAGLYDPDTALRLQRLLEAGGNRDPEALYREFRGRAPRPDALLERKGIA
ncbi:MAG: M3 family metallopeptidase [Myxococcota bacterium]